MPRRPEGHKRPSDVISNAVRVTRIATDEIEESGVTDDGKNKAAVELGRKGGKARAKSLSASARRKIALQAARTRWKRRGKQTH